MEKRRQILTDLLTQLSTITTANDYATDIGAKATYWDVYPEDYSGPPTVTFCDREQITQKANLYNHTLTVEVTAIAYTTAEAKLADSSDLLDDLYRALVVEHWTNSAVIVRPTLVEKNIQGKGKQAIAVVFSLEIEYRD